MTKPAKRGSPLHRKRISDGLKRHHATKGKWIQKAIKHPGALHRQLGIPEGRKIPMRTLRKVSKGNTKLARRARLAITLKGLRKK